MRIQERIVNVKRHTVGFRLSGNRTISRSEAVKLARKNKIEGVAARRGPNGYYIISLPGSTNLYDLPIRMQEHRTRKAAARRRTK